jgi:hypothetical protein
VLILFEGDVAGEREIPTVLLANLSQFEIS